MPDKPYPQSTETPGNRSIFHKMTRKFAPLESADLSSEQLLAIALSSPEAAERILEYLEGDMVGTTEIAALHITDVYCVTTAGSQGAGLGRSANGGL